MDWLAGDVWELLKIIWANAILSGDNAVVIGLAAAGLPAAQRGKAVLFGIVAAAVLRIVFSLFATYLLAFWWVTLLGGFALLYIAWSFFQELREKKAEEEHPENHPHVQKTLGQALWQIVVADVTMSLDNVLAIAAIARDNRTLLVVGLLVSVIMMGLLGGWLARILDRYPVIAYLGVALIVWIAGELIWDGLKQGNLALGLGLPLPGVVGH